MGWDMKDPCKVDVNKDPYDSNQAIPTILFKRDSKVFIEMVKGFNIDRSDWLSLFAYPLSGGFKSWSLLPYRWVKTILKIEEIVLPFLGKYMAFRLMVVLKKE
jgi:hypothetical protein